jgi:hypothetical protein
LECGGKRSATPLSGATGTVEKLRRHCALPEQSKTWRLKLLLCFILLPLAFSLPASAQSYSIDWYKIAGGGGTSTGATYQVTGTIGQPDAGGAMSGGNYSLTGGFWSIISVVQTVGAPTLTITHSDNSVKVSWPYPSTGWTLQQNPDLTTANWTASGGISNDGTNNLITITSPTGNLFFRLQHP